MRALVVLLLEWQEPSTLPTYCSCCPCPGLFNAVSTQTADKCLSLGRIIGRVAAVAVEYGRIEIMCGTYHWTFAQSTNSAMKKIVQIVNECDESAAKIINVCLFSGRDPRSGKRSAW